MTQPDNTPEGSSNNVTATAHSKPSGNQRRNQFKRQTTSLVGDLYTNDMITSKNDEAEEEKKQAAATNAIPKLGAEFKKRSKELIENMILRQRFFDTKDRITLQHRKADWVRDLNLNLITGKLIKATYYFDEQSRREQVKLIKALQ